MRGMMEMREISVGIGGIMVGMQGIRVEMWEMWGIWECRVGIQIQRMQGIRVGM